VGKHIDSNVNNPSENIASGGRPGARPVRLLRAKDGLQGQGHRKAVVARHPHLQGVRRRCGIPDAARLLHPGGTSKEQVAFYVDLLKKVAATPEWKDYLAKQALKNVS